MATSAEQEHDLCLARRHAHHLPAGSVCAVDLGYVGFRVEGCSVVMPFKKPPGRDLEPEQMEFNQRLAKVRVKVEHRIRALKIFRILKGVYRGRRRRFELRLRLIAALVNRMIGG